MVFGGSDIKLNCVGDTFFICSDKEVYVFEKCLVQDVQLQQAFSFSQGDEVAFEFRGVALKAHREYLSDKTADQFVLEHVDNDKMLKAMYAKLAGVK